MEHCTGTPQLTGVWLGAAGVHLDVPLCGHPQDVPLHVDVILAQVYPDLHVVAAALLRLVSVYVKQVNLKSNIFYESSKNILPSELCLDPHFIRS